MKAKNYFSFSTFVIIFIAAIAVVFVKNALQQPTTSGTTNTTSVSEAQRNELRAGYMSGCSRSGIAENICACVFEKTYEKYGLEGMSNLMKTIASADEDSQEFKDYSTFAGKAVIECAD